MVTLEPPELVRVSDNVWLLPTCTLPKLRLVAVAVSDPGVTPVPDSGRPNVGFDALLVIVTAPVALPVALGAKFAVKVVVWPAFKVVGFNPLMLKPVPDATPCEIAIALAPEFVSVTD